jgi:hypothetical protein
MMLKTGPAPFCFFDPGFKEVGSQYHLQYAAGQPVPNIVLDDFLPEEFAELCLTEFPQRSERNTLFARSQENQKVPIRGRNSFAGGACPVPFLQFGALYWFPRATDRDKGVDP